MLIETLTFFLCYIKNNIKNVNYLPLILQENLTESVPKLTANMYSICLSIPKIYTKADAVQFCGKFWDTQYVGTTCTPLRGL